MATRSTFLGFLAKHVVHADWLAVSQVCSVSECISSGPPDRIDHWLHNAAGFYDSAELALAVAESPRYELFAHRICHLQFHDALPEPWSPADVWDDLPDEPTLSGYTPIGYDIVGRGMSYSFECSPLSCNSMANHIPVNEYCLIDELDRAIEVARSFAHPDSGVEPAIYHVVEVLREQKQEPRS